MGSNHDKLVDEEIQRNTRLVLMERRFSKLPKWAQDELKHLEGKLYRLESELKALRGEVESDVHYRSPLELRDKSHPIPQGSTVEFNLSYGKNSEWVGRIRANKQEGGLYINADTAITVEPSASNAILIKVRG